MNYEKIRTNPASFLSITSMAVTLFDEILPIFSDIYDEYFRERTVKGKTITRRRSHVIQANSPLPTLPERLFFILSFLKNDPTQEFMAAAFDMSQQQCGQWIKKLKEILILTLDDPRMSEETVNDLKRLLKKRGVKFDKK